MAFKLTLKEITDRDGITAELENAWAAVDNAVAEYNDAVNEARCKVISVVESYNNVLGEATVWAASIMERMNCEFEDKTEKWQESEQGQSTAAMISEYENFSPDDISVDWPDNLVIENPGLDLEALPEEVSE